MSRHPYRTAPDPNVTGWPSGVPYIIGNEGCERFSFYGMRAILYVYVTALFMNQFALLEDAAKQQATQVVHLFNAAVYAFPLIGAIIADRWWGKYRTILYLSLVYCLGNAVLAFSASSDWQEQWFGRALLDPVWGCYLGLGLIGIGSGGIKPCVSANVGDQFGKGNWHLLSKMFNAFYFIINFGSAFATIIIPLIAGDRYATPEGAQAFRRNIAWAFAVPGILMGLATLFFWMGRRKFVHVPPSRPGMLGLLDVLSGTALFAVVGIPIFGHEFIHSWLWIGLGSAASVILFVILFAVRQRIEPDDGFLGVLFYCCRALFGGRADASRPSAAAGDGAAADPGGDWLARHWFFGPAVARFGREAAEGPVAVLKIMSVFIFVSVFWALFDQHSSTWIGQAEQLDRNVEFSLPTYLVLGAAVGLLVGGAVALTLGRASRWPTLGLGLIGGLAVGYLGYHSVAVGFWGWRMQELLPSQIPAANPFMVMVLIPYTQSGLYPLMKRLGVTPTPLRRMAIGMFIAGSAFAAVAVLQQAFLDRGLRVHVGWQLIGYGLLTVAEVMISITGLEFAYSQAPKRMKSVIMGFWLFNVTLGNVLVAYLAKLPKMPPATFFWLFAGLMALAAVLFSLRAAFYTYRDYTQ